MQSGFNTNLRKIVEVGVGDVRIVVKILKNGKSQVEDRVISEIWVRVL